MRGSSTILRVKRSESGLLETSSFAVLMSRTNTDKVLGRKYPSFTPHSVLRIYIFVTILVNHILEPPM